MREEAIKELLQMIEADKEHGIDREAAHLRADDLLVKRVRELGDHEFADVYDRARNECHFWYA